jgi:hypothetical protein
MPSRKRHDQKLADQANELYWRSEQSVRQIAEATDLSKNGVYALIRPLPAERTCPECGEELVFPNRTTEHKAIASCLECEYVGEAPGPGSKVRPPGKQAVRPPTPATQPDGEARTDLEPGRLGTALPAEVEVSQAGERDAALAAVLGEQTKKTEVEAHARKVRIRRQGLGLRHLVLSVATAMALWIWLWPPGILRVAPAGPPPVEEEEATLRLVMYFQAQKIEQYLLDTGRVPLALDDAGPAFRGMEYIRLTNSDYRILGRTGRVTLSYSSVEPLDAFVGAGASVLNPLVLN